MYAYTHTHTHTSELCIGKGSKRYLGVILPFYFGWRRGNIQGGVNADLSTDTPIQKNLGTVDVSVSYYKQFGCLKVVTTIHAHGSISSMAYWDI